jgi:SAM-dependent methyltransferase
MLVRIDQARTVSRAAHLAGGTALLDIGCGDGLLIAEARRAGLHAYGIDRPNAPLWRGCDPVWRTAGDIESVDQPSESWDVVSLFHVAEHVRDPLQLFARIRGWLRPHGVLVVQVPNAASLQVWLFGRRWFGFDIPRHLTHWSEATLTRALRTTGYAVIARSYVSWRDNAPFFASSLLPSFDPLVERERARPGGKKPLAAMIALRRLTYLATVWAFTPLVLLEAALRRPAVITVLARKAP